MDDNWDDLLDRALAHHSNVDVPSDLNARILHKTSRVRLKRQRAMAMVLCATAIAACALVMTNAPPVQNSVSPPKFESSRLIVPVQLSLAPLPVQKRRVVRRSLPKQDIFPTPLPLNKEERALLAYVQRDPIEAAAAFNRLQEASNSMEVEPIVIPPITVTIGDTP